jgi:hypothetical protein
LTRPAIDFSKLPVADPPEVCLSLVFFSLKFLRTQLLNLDVTSANLKGLRSLFFATNLTLKFTKIKPKFLSQGNTEIEVRECLLSFGAESFVFQFAI